MGTEAMSVSGVERHKNYIGIVCGDVTLTLTPENTVEAFYKSVQKGDELLVDSDITCDPIVKKITFRGAVVYEYK
jgi:hypothetical protein